MSEKIMTATGEGKKKANKTIKMMKMMIKKKNIAEK